jgi:hypothetical protein
MVDSDGHRCAVPNTAATSPGTSSIHSATATNERAPAATAHSGQHDHQAMTDTASLARIDHPTQRVSQPRSERDRIGNSTPPTRSATAAIDKDANAGTALR